MRWRLLELRWKLLEEKVSFSTWLEDKVESSYGKGQKFVDRHCKRKAQSTEISSFSCRLTT
jgi:hypothetical protein